MKKGAVNALLLELMVVVLFFALASSILLRLFAGAYQISIQAGALSDAVIEAQSAADRLYGAQSVSDSLTEQGFIKTEAEDNTWQKDMGDYTLRVTFAEQETEAGTLRSGEMVAWAQDEALLTLPFSRYLPGEAAQ